MLTVKNKALKLRQKNVLYVMTNPHLKIQRFSAAIWSVAHSSGIKVIQPSV